jgi:hypothetical protein
MIPATVIDAGVGNLGNLARALAEAGGEVEVTSEPERVAASRCLLLPGVGAFAPPRERLRGALEEAIRHALAAGAWMLGICVGYQLLFEAGEEFGVIDGLGLLPGRVTRLPEGVPLPHVGWNRLERANGSAGGGEAPGAGEGPAADLLAGLPPAPGLGVVRRQAPSLQAEAQPPHARHDLGLLVQQPADHLGPLQRVGWQQRRPRGQVAQDGA